MESDGPETEQNVLKQLTIRDFALVAKVDVAFDRGLTVVTGESGAGKSILMNALALVVGERARTDLIRPGAQRAEVTAEFDLAEHSASFNALKAADLDDADAPHRCLLRRVISVDGRSRAFVNGVPVNLGMVRELTEGLIDIHSQDENQRLARRDVQLSLLDAYGVPAADRQGMANAYRAARKAEKSRGCAGNRARQRRTTAGRCCAINSMSCWPWSQRKANSNPGSRISPPLPSPGHSGGGAPSHRLPVGHGGRTSQPTATKRHRR